MSNLQQVLDELNRDFVTIHRRKEDLFWDTKMGCAKDMDAARGELATAEIKWNRFLQNPALLEKLKTLRGEVAGPQQAKLLDGWIAMVAAHVIDDPKGRKLSEELVEMEAELQAARGGMKLGYTDPTTGAFRQASSVKLALMMRSHKEEVMRKAAYQGLCSIEEFVLEQNFLDIVKKRNQLGRSLGYVDYYDWRVNVVEGMGKARVFQMLDDLDAQTKVKSEQQLAAFEKKHGPGSLDPWNFGYLRAGAMTERLDPYFPFATALERWGRSFYALGVRYRDATLTLDLVDRQGKYENGFMHGPEPAWQEKGAWHPARINFTANAVVGQKGSGLSALRTLFHEGGHAAHFANILQDAVCFSHEFAPTSVAYAETQSMFMDSLIEDADWRTRYAKDRAGKSMPKELILDAIREKQPFRGWDVRAMLTVPFGERVLYESDEGALAPETLLGEFRKVEKRLQGLSAGARPILAVPHLLAGESSAYYHAYVLAEMAVYQTRSFFMERDGHLTDNPKIGPELAEAYWHPGNSVPYEDTLRMLTGSALSPNALVAECNLTVAEAQERAEKQIAGLARTVETTGPVDLQGTIRVVHGTQEVANTTKGGFDKACADFAEWIDSLEQKADKD